MAVQVIMPKVDMDQETGTVVEWRRHNGDEVKQGDIILVIETNKVAVDVESPGSGILDGIAAAPGEVIPIGTVIAYILSAGEALPSTTDKQMAPAISVWTSERPATPLAKNMAAVHGLDLNTMLPSGKSNKITKADVEARLDVHHSPEVDGKVYASPAARRLARENDIDLRDVQGRGPNGRVQASDVLALAKDQDQVAVHLGTQVTEDEIIPLRGIRRTIAQRMLASHQNIPPIKLTARVNMTKFIEARAKLNEFAEKRGQQSISVTALMVKLVAQTLSQHPLLNSSLKDESILLHKEINIGVAVALENSLIVPVVKNANTKRVGQIAVELNDLVARARSGTLLNADVRGGTFTISNLGPFGIEQFDAIINPPEAAILAIGAIQPEALPNQDGQIVAYPMVRMTLAADHRIIDGAVAARFLSDLTAIFEDPILMTY